MAKSIRSSVRKRNAQKLRKSVYGPAEKARTERLSAKLLEIAAQSRPNESRIYCDHNSNTVMDCKKSNSSNAPTARQDDEMQKDLSSCPSITKTGTSLSSIKKHARRKKAKNSIVFPRRRVTSKPTRVGKR